MRRPSRFPVRLWTVHRWLGWTVGTLFAVVGLAGSVLVVKDTVDAALNPACYARPAVPLSALPPVAEVLRTAYAGVPITDVDTVLLPERLGDPWVLRAEDENGDLEVFVRGDAGAVLCARAWEDTFVGVVSRLHTSLLIPWDWRHETAALLAGGDAALVVVGLVLYVRQSQARRRAQAEGGGRTARQRTGRGTGRRWARLHASFGLGAVLLLPIPIVTGAAMAVNAAARDLAALVLPFAEPPPRPKPLRRMAEAIGPDAAILAAVAAIPGSDPRAVVLPVEDGLPYRVFVRPPGDGRTRSGGSASVFVGPARPEVVGVIDPIHARLGDQVFAARFPLHTGEMWYAPGRAVAFLSGLAPAALLGTAMAAWAARRRRRHAAMEQAEAAAAQGQAGAVGT